MRKYLVFAGEFVGLVVASPFWIVGGLACFIRHALCYGFDFVDGWFE